LTGVAAKKRKSGRSPEWSSARLLEGGNIMIRIKHFMDAIEEDDGQRVWVEPIGCATNLAEWCSIHHVLSNIGPPKKVWEWFQRHPDGYERFRGEYHEFLTRAPYRNALQQLANIGTRENFTLLHQGDDPGHNTASALAEFLSSLKVYTPHEPS
jgi:uncharacterized protein YeaO (DUF488 family)